MAVGVARPYLCAGHAVARVHSLFNILIFQRLRETRPSAAALELIERRKQGFAGYYVDVNAGLVVIPKGILERPLRGVLLRHPELFRSEPGDRLFILSICGHRRPSDHVSSGFTGERLDDAGL